MAKSREAFRTISEVSEWLSVPTHVLRFWESRFKQIKPVKRAGGRRYYRPGDMQLLGGIRRLLHDDGITIKGVQKILREKGVKHVISLCGETLDDLEYVDAAPVQARTNATNTPVKTPDDLSANPAEPKPDPEPAPRVLDRTAPAGFENTAPAEPNVPEAIETSPEIALPRPDVITVAEIDDDAREDRIVALYQRLNALRDRVAAGMRER